MWTIIFGAIFLGGILALIYLVSRGQRLELVKYLSYGKKWLRIFISIGLFLTLFLLLSVFTGVINAVISFLHLTAFWILSELIFFLIRKAGKRAFRRYYAGGAALLFTCCYLLVGWYQCHHVSVTRYDIETSKEIESLRIVLFADSHIGTTFSGEKFGDYVQQMQTEKPDLVIIAGDFIDDDTDWTDCVAACKALGTLKTKYGVYYSLGNHDLGYASSEQRGYSGEDLLRELENNQVIVLRDDYCELDNRIYIIGRCDHSEDTRGSGRKTMPELVSGLNTDHYMLVIDHQPRDTAAEAEAGVDLVLSGHTHGGQLLPVNYVGEWTGANDMTYGRRQIGTTNFIITSGISNWALQYKTGCKSEYVVINVFNR